ETPIAGMSTCTGAPGTTGAPRTASRPGATATAWCGRCPRWSAAAAVAATTTSTSPPDSRTRPARGVRAGRVPTRDAASGIAPVHADRSGPATGDDARCEQRHTAEPCGPREHRGARSVSSAASTGAGAALGCARCGRGCGRGPARRAGVRQRDVRERGAERHVVGVDAVTERGGRALGACKDTLDHPQVDVDDVVGETPAVRVTGLVAVDDTEPLGVGGRRDRHVQPQLLARL